MAKAEDKPFFIINKRGKAEATEALYVEITDQMAAGDPKISRIGGPFSTFRRRAKVRLNYGHSQIAKHVKEQEKLANKQLKEQQRNG